MLFLHVPMGCQMYILLCASGVQGVPRSKCFVSFGRECMSQVFSIHFILVFKYSSRRKRKYDNCEKATTLTYGQFQDPEKGRMVNFLTPSHIFFRDQPCSMLYSEPPCNIFTFGFHFVPFQDLQWKSPK